MVGVNNNGRVLKVALCIELTELEKNVKLEIIGGDNEDEEEEQTV